MKKTSTKYLVLWFSALMVVLDQLFKWLVIEYIKPLPERTFPLISRVFHLTYVENDSMVFGFFNNLSDSGKNTLMVILSVLTAIILVGLIFVLLTGKIKNRWIMWSMGLIIGGGIGNLIDRVFRISVDTGLHYVVDYLDLRIIHFAVFNFADCCVVIGVILLMGYILFFESHSQEQLSSLTTEEATEDV